MTAEEMELENWNWPYLRMNSNGAKEYACPHGTGHGGIHGCDGCCGHQSYGKQIIIKRILAEMREKRKKNEKK